MKKIVKIGVGSLWALPFMALAAGAAGTVDGSYLTGLFDNAKWILDKVVVFLISLAVCWFIWNVISYTISEDEEKKGAAKSQMIWGIVAIAVIVSIWGIVAILQNLFGAGGGTAITPADLLPQ